MPKSKVYLNSVYRTPLVNEDRRGFLRLNMNEYVPGLPEDIVKSVIKNINADTLSAYPEYYSLIQKIAQYNNVGFENICLTNGSDSAIKYVFDAYISRGDKVLYANPTFAMYPVYCKSHGADEVVVDYKNDLSFPKKEFVEHLMNDQINLAIIVNPANPTGSILTKDDLLEILDITKKKDVLLIIDEAYFYFHPETLIQEIKRYNNLVVLRTFSKLCSIAAARIGYVTASEEIVKNIYKVKPSYDVNILAILLANKLLDNTRILEQLLTDFNEGKKYIITRLIQGNIEHNTGNANFILIKCGQRVNEIADKLKKEKVLVYTNSHDCLRDYIRVTIGNKDVMSVFWRKFIKIWDNNNKA